MEAAALSQHLCRTFCADISVRAVPAGYAIGTSFIDSSGDPIGFYLIKDLDGFYLDDDGEFLSSMVARDISIDGGQRASLLNSILGQSNSYWDRDTYEIKSNVFKQNEIGRRCIDFLSSLIRVRDLELLTRESVRSAFRDDALSVIIAHFGKIADIDENAPVSPQYNEFPADIVIRPRNVDMAVPAAVYLANSNDKLNEALLFQKELSEANDNGIAVVALIEDADMKLISHKRFQRAQNRALPMPILRGDESGAMNLLARKMRMPPPFVTLVGTEGTARR